MKATITTILVERSTRAGQPIQIGIGTLEGGAPALIATCAGQTFTETYGLSRWPDAYRRDVERTLGTGFVASIGKIAIRAEEFMVLDSAIRTARAGHEAAKLAALEAAVPGLIALRAARQVVVDAEDAQQEGMQRFMDDGEDYGKLADGPTAAQKAELVRLRAEHPRAALYLQAEAQSRKASAIGSDNTGAGAAGDRCMAILAAGGSMEDATAAAAARNLDWGL